MCITIIAKNAHLSLCNNDKYAGILGVWKQVVYINENRCVFMFFGRSYNFLYTNLFISQGCALKLATTMIEINVSLLYLNKAIINSFKQFFKISLQILRLDCLI